MRGTGVSVTFGMSVLAVGCVLTLVACGLQIRAQLGGKDVLRDASGVLGITVRFSVVAHGISATPGAAAYGRWVKHKSPVAETAQQ